MFSNSFPKIVPLMR